MIILSLQLIAANSKRTTKLLSQHFHCTVFGYLSEGEQTAYYTSAAAVLYMCSYL